MSTIGEIQQILANQKLDSFIGRKEDFWFEAKSTPYDLNSPNGRWELAKDVSAFANAEGGFVIVGLTTVPVPQEQTDEVSGLVLVPSSSFSISQVKGVLGNHLFPSIQGIEVSWIQNGDGSGLGVGVIYVPEQAQDRRFTLMVTVVDQGVELRRFVFGFVTRHKSGSAPLTLEQLHAICQTGRSTGAERLTRIEEKLDRLILLGEKSAAADTEEPQSYEAEMKRRLNDIISHTNGK